MWSRSRKFWKGWSRKFWEVGVGTFGKIGVGVGFGYFTSDSATLLLTLPVFVTMNVEEAFEDT